MQTQNSTLSTFAQCRILGQLIFYARQRFLAQLFLENHSQPSVRQSSVAIAPARLRLPFFLIFLCWQIRFLHLTKTLFSTCLFELAQPYVAAQFLQASCSI
ncbi:MAG: hypothetical protein ACI9XO_003532 [Paraglaciecola sp.]|jgi:hypothetical protein